MFTSPICRQPATILDLRTSGVLTFTDADEYPHSWTPDSRSVIFESFRNGNFDLFRQDIDQSDAQSARDLERRGSSGTCVTGWEMDSV